MADGGWLAGGLAEGLSNGVGMADKLRQLHEAARLRAARAAVGRAYASDAPMGADADVPPVTPPSPGQASVPAGSVNPLAAMGASAGAPPPPDAAPPPPPPPPMAAPANMPAGPAGPATGSDGTPLSGVAASTGAPAGEVTPDGGPEHVTAVTTSIQDANNTIKAIASAVRQANPDIDPETLFNAVSQHVEQMKGVRNEVKDYMTAQVEYAKMQERLQRAAMNIAGRKDVQGLKNEGAENVAETRAAAARDVGAGHDAARIAATKLSSDAREAAAQIAAQGGITRAQIADDSRRFVVDANNRTRVYDTQLQTWAKIANANSGDEARVDAATVLSGGTAPARKRLNPLPMPTAPDKTYLDAQGNPVATPAPKPAAAGQSFKNLASLQAAFKAGQVDAATARQVAVANGWVAR